MCHDIQTMVCCQQEWMWLYVEFRKMLMITLYAEQKEKTQIYRTIFLTLWEKARVGCFKRTALKPVYYLGWNRSPAHIGCMRQELGPGALGKARGNGWRGRWEWGLGWGKHVNPWLFHLNVWQNPPQIKEKRKKMVNVMSYKVPMVSYMQWVWFHSYIGCDVINQVSLITQTHWVSCPIHSLCCHSFTMWDVLCTEHNVTNIVGVLS